MWNGQAVQFQLTRVSQQFSREIVLLQSAELLKERLAEGRRPLKVMKEVWLVGEGRIATMGQTGSSETVLWGRLSFSE